MGRGRARICAQFVRLGPPTEPSRSSVGFPLPTPRPIFHPRFLYPRPLPHTPRPPRLPGTRRAPPPPSGQQDNSRTAARAVSPALGGLGFGKCPGGPDAGFQTCFAPYISSFPSPSLNTGGGENRNDTEPHSCVKPCKLPVARRI